MINESTPGLFYIKFNGFFHYFTLYWYKKESNMLYYIKIGAFEGVDYTRGQGYLESNKKNKILKSKECKACNFYFF